MSVIMQGMFIVLHVVVAITSLLYGLFLLIAPSQHKLYIATALVTLTLLSGTYLVVSSHSHLLPACTAGLIYLGAVCSQLVFAKRRLAQEVATDKIDTRRSR